MSRRVRVDEGTANIILDGGKWVFGGSEPGRPDLAAKKFKRVAVRADVGHLTPTSLRYFYAVTLLESNKMPYHEIANLLGYKSPDGMLRKFGRQLSTNDVVAPDIIRYALRQQESP